MKLHLNKLFISLITVLTSITLFESPIVHAENAFDVPDSNAAYTQSNSYAQPIPMDAGQFREFEFPNDSETTYVAVGNTNTTYTYTDSDYQTFRDKLVVLGNVVQYGNHGDNNTITYNKYYIYDSPNNFTGDYIITFEMQSSSTNIYFNDESYSYEDIINPLNTSNVSGLNGKMKFSGSYINSGIKIVNFDENYNCKNFIVTLGQFQTYGACRSCLAVYRKSLNKWYYLDSINNSGASLGMRPSDLQNHEYGSGGGSSSTSDIYISDERLPAFGITGSAPNSLNELVTNGGAINKDNYRIVPCNPDSINDFVDTVHKNHGNSGFSYHRILCSYLKANIEGSNKLYKLCDQMDDYGIFTSASAVPSDPFSASTYYSLNVTSNNDEYGTVNITAGAYLAGDVVNLLATPTSNAYRFLRWSDGDTNAEREITIAGNLTLQAIFGAKTEYTVTLHSVDEYAAHFEGEGTYYDGDIIDIKAIPYKGYEFSHWSDGIENESRSITVDDNIDLTAYFFTGGSSGGKIDAGPIITVIIIAAFLLMLKGF